MSIKQSHICERNLGAIVIEFRSNKLIGIATGLVIGIIGSFMLLFLMFADEGVPFYLGPLGIIFIILSIAAFTFRKVVRIDKERILVERAIKAFFWKKIQLFPIKDFDGVGITTGSRSSKYSGPKIVYFVQLLGRKNVSIPGSSTNLDRVLSRAKQIAGFVHLPIDETPRIRFTVFGW
jgi:hypothetical protein